jgi:diacylglycerol kinase (ATP)
MTTPPKRFSVRSRLRSVYYAFRGARLIVSSQHAAWIHAGWTVAVVVAGFCFRLDRLEWCAIVLAVMAVWTAEGMNTALEFLCDVASPETHPLIEKSKDVAAGAVLFSAVGAIVIGLLILGPHLLAMLR